MRWNPWLRFLLLLLSVSSAAPAANEPYMVEAKVQGDLDAALSRLIPRDQFLVLVTTEIKNRAERKLIEGETIANPRKPERPEVAQMPGFTPESEPEIEDRPDQTRQLYRIVETPVLTSVRVHVTLDEELEPEVVTKAKQIVQNYLRASHPSVAMLSFDQIPMLKPLSKEDKEKKDAAVPPMAKTQPDEPWWAQYVPVGIVALLGLLALAFSRGRGEPPQRKGAGRSAEDAPNPYAYPFNAAAQHLGRPPARETNSEEKKANPDAELPILRKRVLDRFLSRPEAFRLYFDNLTEQGRAEMCSALKGPAMDNLLSGLGLRRPKGEDFVPPDLGEYLERQEKDFSEFVQAKDWQDRQFFGFLTQMTDRQVQALVGQSSPQQTAAMLRFMKPHQSARALESLPTDKRRDVIAQARELSKLSFSELEAIERDIRSFATRLPNQMYTSAKGDIDFWGSILTEAENQEAILEDLEHTNPNIYPNLKRYKFKLEDAASLPDSLLERILGEADNEELGLALATCPSNVVEVILDSLSPRRRDFVMNQFESFRQAPRELAVQARQTLTKRFREVLS